MQPRQDRFLIVGGILFVLVLAILACVCMNALTYHHEPKNLDPLAGPPRIRPDDGGLRLYGWYRPAQPGLGWDKQQMRWRAGVQNGQLAGLQNGQLDFGTPVYVVERRGSVAVCRGAVHGVILVPDCCAYRFVPVHGPGELGERLDQPSVEK